MTKRGVRGGPIGGAVDTIAEQDIAADSDDLLLMSTPPPNKTPAAPSSIRHPARRALEQQQAAAVAAAIDGAGVLNVDDNVDRMFSLSPNGSSGGQVQNGGASSTEVSKQSTRSQHDLIVLKIMLSVQVT